MLVAKHLYLNKSLAQAISIRKEEESALGT